MRKFLAIIIFIASMAISANAQDKIGEYLLGGVTKNIEASNSVRGVGLYIDIDGEYRNDNVTLIIHGEKEIKSFCSEMAKVADKFDEWVKVAKENNVTDLTKEFNVSLPNVEIGWRGSSDWYFDFSEYLRPLFMIMELESGEIDYCIGMGGTATASSNQYIDQKYYMILKDSKEIRNLLKVIDYDNVVASLKKKDDKENLFK